MSDIHEGLQIYHETPGAVLLDVRTPEEYSGGHIPGSLNIPLQAITAVTSAVENKDTPLFVYCQSGGRSRLAARGLSRMGYTSVTDIGGMVTYSGQVER